VTFITISDASLSFGWMADHLVTRGGFFMLTANQLEVAETMFDRNQRREAEINDAVRQEQARHQAAVKNMLRLRALRLARDTKEESANRKPKMKR
jgi:hypothetical protein